MAWGEKEAKSAAFEKRKTDECDHNGHPIGVRKLRGREAALAHRALKPMRFTSLHHHTTFSYLDGYQLPEAHIRRATEINMANGIAFTEHGNISSHVKAEIAGEKQGLKVMFGCEIYTGKTGRNATQRKYHLTVLAKDQEGYRNLLKLVSEAYSSGFHYEPTVSWEMLNAHKQGLVVLSGCQGSLLFCSAVGGKLISEDEASPQRAMEVARRFKRAFGDNYFVEVQAFPELEKTRRANPILARIAERLGIGLVATMDCHYTAPTESEIQQVLHNVRPGEKRTLEDQVRDWGYDVPLCPPTTDKAVYTRLRATGLTKRQAVDAIINTELIAQDIDVTLPKLPMLRFPLPQGYKDGQQLWREWLKEGWRYRGCHLLPPAEKRAYKERLRYEMGLIEEKDFTDYFLVVSDSVKYAKDNGIPVGPARGSAAASLACWLLRITEVNPMLFPNLVFERFIDVSRADLPDIDLDFDSDKRHLVREYLVAKYGEKCVNNIGTFSYYKSRMALDDVAKVHKVPPYEVDKIKDVLIERSSGDLRASATIEDTVEQFDQAREVVERYPILRKAMELEGNVKQFGVHSAGLVVSNGDIRDVCAVYEREVKGRLIQVVSMDKYDAERQGLLKLDYLGLSTMALIAEALRQLDMTLNELYDLPLNDPAVIQGFQENDVAGIFQFDGRAMRSVCGALKPDSFKEICDVNALSRPGPLHNGAANQYIDIKRGVLKPELMHPALDKITADTHYQIVYQEQILRVVTEIGNFDWTHASYIRKIISKKLGEQEFQRQWERFWEGAKTYHKRFPGMPKIDLPTAQKIWGLCITSGSYAFNAAHCVSYGMLGYWTMWIKRNHPAVFFAAALAKLPKGVGGSAGSGSAKERGYGFSGVSIDRHTTLLRDAATPAEHITRDPIDVLPPDPRRSQLNWIAPADNKLLAGFKQVPNVGDAVGQKMLDYRAEQEVKQWRDYLEVKGIGPKTIQKIKDLCADPDPFRITRLDRMLAKVKDDLDEGIAGANGKDLPYPTHTAQEVPYERGKDVAITWVGMGLDRNLRDIFESNRARTGVELKPEEVKEPDKNEWVMIAGYDGTELVTLRIDRFKYPKFRDAVWKIKLGHDILLVQGVKPGFRTAREIYVSKLWVLSPPDEGESDE